jgi:hypothetical protein
MQVGKGTALSEQGVSISGKMVMRLMDGIPKYNYSFLLGMEGVKGK